MYCCQDSLILIPIWFSEDFRPDEFIWRLNSDSYETSWGNGGALSILYVPPGASFEEPEHKAEWFLDTMSRMSPQWKEKSGYGTDRDTELKQLSVMQAINESRPESRYSIPLFKLLTPYQKEYKGQVTHMCDFLIEMCP